MPINFALATFEGPLDLLLQLVRRSQISVWEIRIQSICDQFIAYTRQLEMVDVELAGEFLVMASTLIRIKARLLLPQPETEPDAKEDEIDPEEELITRLLLYEGFKEAADALEEMAATSLALYPRGQAEELPVRETGDPLAGVSLLTLAVMAQQVYEETEPEVIKVEAEDFTVADRMAFIEHTLRGSESSADFRELLSAAPTREEIVVTFLAILELVRLLKITVWQESPTTDVILFGRNQNAS